MNFALLLAYLLLSTNLFAADHYWVGGTGDWNDPTHWAATSGGSGGIGIPAVGDNVFFDNHSFSADNQQVTISGNATCDDFVWAGLTKEIILAGGSSANLNIHGSLIFDLKLDNQFSGAINFVGSGQGNIIETRRIPLNGDLIVNGSGSWNMTSNVLMPNDDILLQQGELNTNGQVVHCANFVGSGTTSRSLKLGSSAIFLTAGWDFEQTTNLTFYSGTSDIVLDNSIPQENTKPGGLDYNNFGLRAATCGTGAGETPFTITTTVTVNPAYNGEDVSCNGACDAEICVSVVGGIGPFTYAWVGNGCTPAPNTPCWNGVGAGAYLVLVTDNGQPGGPIVCNDNVSVTEPVAMAPFNFQLTDPTCNGDCDGTGSTIIVGGVPPYSYCWNGTQPGCVPNGPGGSGGETTQNAVNLCTGVNTLNVTDLNGCTLDTTFIINTPTPIFPNVVVNDVTCFGDCNGSAYATPYGGNGVPYSYQWYTGANAQAGNEIPGMVTDTLFAQCAGTYSVTVTDLMGCVNDTTIVISEPAQLSITLDNQVDLVCNSICDGELTASVTQGTAPYTFEWFNGPFGSNNSTGIVDVGVNTSTASSLCAGDYFVVVTDANGCQDSLGLFTITEPPAMTATTSATDYLCFGSCTGTATVVTGGGTGIITCEWFSVVSGSIGQFTPTATNLCADDYYAVCTDANGCQIISDTSTVSEPPELIVTATATPVTCFGDCDGTATATDVGGTGAIGYEWFNSPSNTSTGQTTQTATGLCPGDYYVVATDANACDDTSAVVTVTEPTELDPLLTSTDVSCNGVCDGTADVTVTQGTPGYTYSWVLLPGTPVGGNSPNVAGLCAGNYEVTITDANLCDTVVPFTITEPPALTSSITASTNVTCGGACDGTATASSSGGTAPITCDWFEVTLGNIGQNTATATGLCPGDYYVVCTDANGCTTNSDTVTITEPNVLTVTAVETDIVCNGDCSGSATATPVGGTPAFNYEWFNSPSNTSTGQTTQTATNLCPGDYYVVVTDANGCTAQSNIVTVDEPTAIDPVLSVFQISCNGVCDGAASVAVSGGTPGYTFLWQDPSMANIGTGPSVNGLCPGTYTLTVTDAALCDSVMTFDIIEPAVLATTLTPTSPTCDGACDGLITSNTTGGTIPYTYQWHSGPTATNPILGEVGPDLVGACAGTYTLEVTDGNGCVVTATATITDPPGMTITLDGVTSSACLGACSGTINITVTGGQGPYTYEWVTCLNFNPIGDTSEDPINLCADNYGVIVTDANGCMDTLCNIIVNTNPLVTGTLTVNQASCPGVCDGSASVNASGGTPPYTFLWQDSQLNTWGPGNSISGLCPDNYQVVITDGNGCVSAPLVFTINNIPDITAITDSVPTTCQGVCDGEAIVFPSGGTGTLTATWPGIAPNPFVGTNPTGLCAGVYDVTITDDNGCTLDTTVEVTEPVIFTADATETDILCNGTCSGDATVTMTGGAAPFTFQWFTPGGAVPGGITQTINNLCPDDYWVVVTDANGCTNNSDTVTVDEPPLLVVGIINVVHNLCNGDCNGSAEADVTGGTGPYTYLWDDPTGQTTPVATGLCAGTYTVTVTDANGCVETDQITITEPTGYDLTITSNDVLCNGDCNGSATVTVNSGGTPPYTFLWDDPLTQNTSTAINLCPGNYTCTVTDANGCDSIVPVTIGEPAALGITTNTTDPTCDGLCDGQAYVTVTGGVLPFTYDWTDNTGTTVSTTDTLNNACDGVYDVLVTDVNGCTITAQVTLTAPLPITGTAVSSLASCGACDATSTVTPAGGTPPFTNILWTGPCGPASGQGTFSVTGIGAGIYTVTFEDANGCIGNVPVLINNVPSEIIEADSTDVTCNGICDGSAYFNYLLGGCIDAPCTVQWLDATATPIPGSAGLDSITGLCSGLYIVEVINASGCIVYDSTFVNEPTSIIGNEVITDPSCNGVCDGEITIAPSGGTGPYTVLWSSGGNAFTETNLCAGNDTAFVTDANGCTDTLVYTLTEPPVLDASNVTSTGTLCDGGSDGTTTVFAAGGTPGYTYDWIDCNSGTSIGQTGQQATNLSPGDYQVLVTDLNGCTDLSPCVNVPSPTPLAATFTIVDVSCFGECDGSIQVNVSGGTPNYTYQWLDVNGIPIPGATNDILVGLCADDYSVIITDLNGCTLQPAPQTIATPAEIVAAATATDVLCNGDCNGTATVVVVGGIPALSYQWYDSNDNPVAGATGATATNLCPDDYYVIVTDNTGCDDTSNVVTVSAPLPLTSNEVISDALCNASCDGSITIAPAGGTGPYTVLWGGGQNTLTITNLCAGFYDVIITDANGCQLLDTFEVTEPTPILGPITGNDATCGVCNGSAVANVSGGTPGYTYDWFTAGNQNTNTALNLCAGIHALEVTDNNGCIDTFTVAISDIGAEVLTTDTTHVTCFGGNDGTATVIYTCSQPNCSNQWYDGASGSPLAGQTGLVVNNLTAGDYYVEVTNGLGCIAVAQVTVFEPQPFAVNDSVVDATCGGVCDGEIYIFPTGGTPPYTISWPSIPSNQDTLLNMCAGSYDVIITDALLCDTTFTIVINEPTVIDVTNIVATDITCNGANDGTAEVFPTGGTVANDYNYEWFDCGTGTTTSQTTAQATGLAPGDYQVVVTDDLGCTVTSVCVTINEPAVLATSTAVTDVTCFGGADGAVDLTIAGGTPPYTQVWNPGGMIIEDPANLAAGTYTVLVTDDNGCTATETVTVNEPTQITATFVAVDATCGLCDGELTVTPAGGSGAGYTYAWSNGATTQTVTGLCAGSYTVQITDGAGCVENVNVTLNNINGPTIDSVVVVDATCFGACDGTADVFVSGGVAPYSYLWLHDGSTTSGVVGLCAGTYTVEVTDANNCMVVATAVVSSPSQIVDNNVIIPTTCGGADGSITLTPTGGSGAGYTYVWTPNVSATNAATNLAAGLYCVDITDGAGCTETYCYNVSASTAPQATIAGTDANCNGVCDGSADATVQGGTLPYTFDWQDASGTSIGQTTEDATNLCAGDYILEITDAAGCVGYANVTINEPDALIAASSFSQDASCNGACDGAANVQIIGGTLPYSYIWTDGSGAQVGTTDSITGACADTYDVNILDANLCPLGPVTVVVNDPPAITATFNVTDANCNQNDGAAEVIPAGGTPGYTVQWDSAGVLLGTNPIQGGLYAGTYGVTVTDTNGCSNTFQVLVSNINAPVVTINSITDVTCFGDCDGAVDISISGVNGPFTALWNPGPFLTEDLTNVCPGTYLLQVTDALGCLAFDTVTVGEPAQLAANVTETDATCGDCDGQIDVVMTTGVAPYSYDWSNGGTNATEGSLCPGTYQVIVADANGCEEIFSGSVSNINGPTTAVTTTPAVCPGSCDGTADVQAIGGTGPFTFFWPHNGSISSTLNNLCAGTYTCEVTDANGCVDIATIIITEPTAWSDSTIIVPTTCGGSDGSINVTVFGGTSPYSYQWSASAGGGTNPVVSGIPAGPHTLDVVDALGCTHTFLFAVPSSTSPTATLTVTDVQCYNACDGIIDTASVVDGTAPYSFDLLDAVGVSVGPGPQVTGLCPGDYTMQVTDAVGCIGFATATVNEPDSIFFNIPTTIDASCGGTCDGSATVIANGGSLPYTFSWDDPSGQTTATATGLCAGTWTCTITDANGCTAQQSVTIAEPTTIAITVDLVVDALCLTSNDGSIDISVTGGTGPYTYQWNGPNNTATTEDVVNVGAGQHIIVVTDANNCTGTDTITVGAQIVVIATVNNDTTICEGECVTLYGGGGTTYEWQDLAGQVLGTADTLVVCPGVGSATYVLMAANGPCFDYDTVVVDVAPTPVVDAGPDVTVIEGSTATIGGNPTGPAGSTFSWSPSLLLNDSTLANPDATVELPGTYIVTVTSPDGCVGTDSMNVIPLPDIQFPNGITPNGDGFNDTWIIDQIEEFPDAVVEIYNRWGQMLFRSVGYVEQWDGTFEGKPLPVGTYYYVIDLKNDLYPDAYTGPITILR